MSNVTDSSARRPLFSTLFWGLMAGLFAGLAMLLTMALLRMLFGWPTPTELIFDRLFPLLTVEFFISSLVKAGGYTPLKLQGVFGALAGQIVVAGIGGVIYALYLRCRVPGAKRPNDRALLDPRGWSLIVPGVLAATVLFVALLWPTLITNYRGLPPGTARLICALEMLISFSVCGFGIMFFYGLLDRPKRSLIARQNEQPVTPNIGLRRFLALGVGAAVAVALGGLLKRLFTIGTFGYDGRQYRGPKVQKITPIRPEDEFYQVSKNLVDPNVARDSWRLDIVGQVENPRVYSFADIAAMPAVEQETTLLCISYGVGSGLCSNAIWKGVPLPTLLAQVKPKPEVTTVLFRAADGYYETFKFEKAMEPTTLVAYEMNGEPLPQRHGYPLRMIVPGLYGEKNPKWLTRIELLNEADGRLHRRHGCGFYKEQGWGREGDVVPTHSRIDAPQVAGDHFQAPFKVGQPAKLRGMALGGDRGISKVEVSDDDGETWNDARITQPGTKISWSLWSYNWTPEEEGETKLVVRATDGEGKLQIAEYRDQVPDGATGLHRVKARVERA
ncbi:MAG: Protein-methionine-sulfoxide reductase catalytic subunit MsrP [Candidatus Udaeobacter sp.]|nr:MAG: Protein-methionine-sulfoxide reductase catalytic subunit MsrP [Candidatus Udaeobacter sp.]